MESERAAQVASTHATRHWHPSCSKSSSHSNSTELPGMSSRKPSPLTFEKWTKPRPGRAGVETAPQPSSPCQNATVPSDTGADRIFDLPAPKRRTGAIMSPDIPANRAHQSWRLAKGTLSSGRRDLRLWCDRLTIEPGSECHRSITFCMRRLPRLTHFHWVLANRIGSPVLCGAVRQPQPSPEYSDLAAGYRRFVPSMSRKVHC
jgi:hypothetical protein